MTHRRRSSFISSVYFHASFSAFCSKPEWMTGGVRAAPSLLQRYHSTEQSTCTSLLVRDTPDQLHPRRCPPYRPRGQGPRTAAGYLGFLPLKLALFPDQPHATLRFGSPHVCPSRRQAGRRHHSHPDGEHHRGKRLRGERPQPSANLNLTINLTTLQR